MADTAVEAKEVAVAAEKDVVEKKAEETPEVEEKEKVTENGTNGTSEESKENGTSEEEAEEAESTENGTTESTDAVSAGAKRKSTGGESETVPTEGVTPEKKAKLAEPADEEEEASNGPAEAEATA